MAINVLAAFALRRNHDPTILDHDERDYWSLAQSILTGNPSEVIPRRTLPFPCLLAGLRQLLDDDYFRVQLAVSVLLALIPLLVYRVVRRELTIEPLARMSALGVMAWPMFLKYNATLYSDPTGVLTLLSFLWILPGPKGERSMPSSCVVRLLLAGMCLAVCVHVKPLYLFYTPIAFAVVVWRESTWRGGMVAGALLTLGCLLVLVPYAGFLSAREHRLILVSANDGETLAGGLNPALLASGVRSFTTLDGRVTWDGPGKWVPPHATGYLSEEELVLPYTVQGRLLSERTLAWIRSNPEDAAYLTIRKLSYMWGIYPFWQGLWQTLLGNMLVLPLLLAASFVVIRFRKHAGRLAVFWTLPVLSSVVACFSWGSWRFRMPADVGLIVLAACVFFQAELRATLGMKPTPCAKPESV